MKSAIVLLWLFFVLLQIQRKILTETNGIIVFLIMVLRKYVFCPRGDLNERGGKVTGKRRGGEELSQ